MHCLSCRNQIHRGAKHFCRPCYERYMTARRRRKPDQHPTQPQPCPACDGTMPPEAVLLGDWSLDDTDIRPVLRRVVSMHCPHCGHRENRVEQERVNCFIV